MPLSQALLAVLSTGPNHGYELKSIVERDLGSQWGPINVGHFYQVLDRLARDGYITGKQVRQRVRPNRTVFRITAAGRAELDCWFAAPTDAAKERRGDLLLKLVAAAHLGEDTIRAVIRNERHAHLETLHALSAERADSAAHSSAWLLVEAARVDTDARLRILDLAEQHAAALVRNAGQVTHDKPEEDGDASLPA
jgi:DNA-binding PadR family transcriptional regulator